MGKVVAGILIVFLLLGGGMYVYKHYIDDEGRTRVSNDEAEKNEEKRYLTIVNKTGKIINEVHVYVGDGTEIKEAYQENPDEKSFSVEIPEQYIEYKKFTVELVTNHDLLYRKVKKKVKATGRTEVSVKEENRIEQDGDFFNELEEAMNGD